MRKLSRLRPAKPPLTFKKSGSLARICGDGEERPVAADGFDAYRRSQIMIGCGIPFPDAACWSCDGSRAARLSPRCSYRLLDCPTWATFSDSRFCFANSAQVDAEAPIRDHLAGAYGEAPQRQRDVIPPTHNSAGRFWDGGENEGGQRFLRRVSESKSRIVFIFF
jgi:hypothetical protein